MAWGLKWGDHVKAFELQAKRTGVTPRPLLNRPRLLTQDVVYYNAFNDLSSSRPSSMGGASPIPISEVLAFCELLGIANLRERAKYLRLVRELDKICLDHWSEALKQKQKTK